MMVGAIFGKYLRLRPQSAVPEKDISSIEESIILVCTYRYVDRKDRQVNTKQVECSTNQCALFKLIMQDKPRIKRDSAMLKAWKG